MPVARATGTAGLVLAMLLAWVRAPAATVDMADLYEGEVVVVNQGNDERDAATRAVMAQTLVRLTGDRHAPSAPELADLLSQAPRYLDQFRYQLNPPETPAVVGGPQGYRLWVRLQAEAVDRALQARGRALWVRQRPVVLAWVALEEFGLRRLVTNPLADPLAARLQVWARERGVPLRLPEYDLAEQGQVALGDIWGGFHERVVPTAARYGAEAVWIARVYPDAGGWGGDSRTHATQGAPGFPEASCSLPRRDDCARELFDRMVDALAAQYLVPADTATDVVLRVRIDGVARYRDYARVMQYLRGLTGVQRAEPAQAEGDRLDVDLWMRGGRGTLERLVTLGSLLRVASTAGDPQLVLQLRP